MVSRFLWVVLCSLGSSALASEFVYESESFTVGSDTFRVSVRQIGAWEYKIHLSRKYFGKWLLQQRFLKDADAYEGLLISDKNADGCQDVEVFFRTGATMEYENFLFLYDSLTCSFKNVEEYWWYGGSYDSPICLNERECLFCSFIYWGCSGDSWESHLFQIRNFQIVRIGSAWVEMCDDMSEIRIFQHFANRKSEQKICIGLDYVNQYYNEEKEMPWKVYLRHYWKKYGLNYLEDY